MSTVITFVVGALVVMPMWCAIGAILHAFDIAHFHVHSAGDRRLHRRESRTGQSVHSLISYL